MSDRLGPLTFGKKEEQIFLGREIAQHRDYSEDTAVLIDDELKRLAREAYERAEKVVQEHRDALVRIAEALLEFEVLDGEEVASLVKGGEVASLTARKRQAAAPTLPEPAATARPAAEIARAERPGASISVDPIKQPS